MQAAGDNEVALYRHPAGDPQVGWVFLAHATGFCAGALRPVAEELRRAGFGGEVVSWDFRNHGRSPRRRPPFDWWEVAADVAAVRRAHPGHPAVAMGHSMGGATVAMAQLADPTSFDALVLVEPIIPPPPYGFLHHPLVDAALKRRRWFASREEARENFATKPVFARWDPRALQGYLEGGLVDGDGGVELACRPEDEAEFYRAASAHGLLERLGELTVPVTLVVGSDSDAYPREWAEELAARCGATLEVVESTTHFLPMERPDRVAALILKALSANPGF